MIVEDEIATLKYQLSEMEKRYSTLESELHALRQKFAGFNSQFTELKALLPEMTSKYNDISGRFDIRMKSYEKKLDEILRLTKENRERRLQSTKVVSL